MHFTILTCLQSYFDKQSFYGVQCFSLNWKQLVKTNGTDSRLKKITCFFIKDISNFKIHQKISLFAAGIIWSNSTCEYNSWFTEKPDLAGNNWLIQIVLILVLKTWLVQYRWIQYWVQFSSSSLHGNIIADLVIRSARSDHNLLCFKDDKTVALSIKGPFKPSF